MGRGQGPHPRHPWQTLSVERVQKRDEKEREESDQCERSTQLRKVIERKKRQGGALEAVLPPPPMPPWVLLGNSPAQGGG